jgi:hypothetical protein
VDIVLDYHRLRLKKPLLLFFVKLMLVINIIIIFGLGLLALIQLFHYHKILNLNHFLILYQRFTLRRRMSLTTSLGRLLHRRK